MCHFNIIIQKEIGIRHKKVLIYITNNSESQIIYQSWMLSFNRPTSQKWERYLVICQRAQNEDRIHQHAMEPKIGAFFFNMTASPKWGRYSQHAKFKIGAFSFNMPGSPKWEHFPSICQRAQNRHVILHYATKSKMGMLSFNIPASQQWGHYLSIFTNKPKMRMAFLIFLLLFSAKPSCLL